MAGVSDQREAGVGDAGTRLVALEGRPSGLSLGVGEQRPDLAGQAAGRTTPVGSAGC